MKNFILSISLLSSLLSFASCGKEHLWIKGSGPVVSENRAVSGFSGISLSFDVEVVVQYDSVFSIELQGQQNILEHIVTQKSGGNLIISKSHKVHIRSHAPIKAIIRMPTVDNIEISGSGSVSIGQGFATSVLNTNISGSGSLWYDGYVTQRIDARVSGSGNIHIRSSNSCTFGAFRISGSGSIFADNLELKQAEVHISGSGSLRIYATEKLEVNISGSGKIFYKGNPAIEARISGSGKLYRL